VARLGGDEFVVLLCDLDSTSDQARQAAHHVAQKILSALAQPYQLALEEGAASTVVEHQCSASAGLVLFTGHTTAADTLLEQADAAMYAAKKAGRNQVCLYAPNSPAANPGTKAACLQASA
jgi:diguanylate cyclase (GGDEF)-like protein